MSDKGVRERKMAPNQGERRLVEWIKSDWYCYVCGKQDVWQRTDEGDDYYVNRSATCGSCGGQMIGLDKVEDVTDTESRQA